MNKMAQEDSKKDVLNKKFTCTICFDQFVSNFNLNRHVKMVHFKVIGVFKCHKCPKQYEEETKLSDHINRAHRTFTCKVLRHEKRQRRLEKRRHRKKLKRQKRLEKESELNSCTSFAVSSTFKEAMPFAGINNSNFNTATKSDYSSANDLNLEPLFRETSKLSFDTQTKEHSSDLENEKTVERDQVFVDVLSFFCDPDDLSKLPEKTSLPLPTIESFTILNQPSKDQADDLSLICSPIKTKSHHKPRSYVSPSRKLLPRLRESSISKVSEWLSNRTKDALKINSEMSEETDKALCILSNEKSFNNEVDLGNEIFSQNLLKTKCKLVQDKSDSSKAEIQNFVLCQMTETNSTSLTNVTSGPKKSENILNKTASHDEALFQKELIVFERCDNSQMHFTRECPITENQIENDSIVTEAEENIRVQEELIKQATHSLLLPRKRKKSSKKETKVKKIKSHKIQDLSMVSLEQSDCSESHILSNSICNLADTFVKNQTTNSNCVLGDSQDYSFWGKPVESKSAASLNVGEIVYKPLEKDDKILSNIAEKHQSKPDSDSAVEQLEENDDLDNFDESKNLPSKIRLNFRRVTLKKQPKEEFPCSHCSKYFATSDELVQHKKQTMTRICHFCNQTFKFKENLKRHIRNIHGRECKICDLVFPDLKHHNAMEHPTVLKLFVQSCKICKIGFNNATDYQSHRDRIHGLPSCSICSKTFKTNPLLKIHLSLVHLNKQACKCDDCGKSFQSRSTLFRHQRRTHLKTEKFTCEACDKTFYVGYDLEMHMNRNHREQLQFPCLVCHKILNSNSELIKHVKSAHAEKEQREEPKKTVKCNICQNYFAAKYLGKHMKRVHPLGDPLRVDCKECKESFAASYLQKHIKRVHLKQESKRVECEICHQFYAPTSLAKHKRNLHSITRITNHTPDEDHVLETAGTSIEKEQN